MNPKSYYTSKVIKKLTYTFIQTSNVMCVGTLSMTVE